MWFDFRPIELDFLETAPNVYVVRAEVKLPRPVVWSAIIDAPTWHECGAVPMVVAANLGHSDTRMVERHYGHLADKFKKEMIRATAPTFGRNDGSNVERLGAKS